MGLTNQGPGSGTETKHRRVQFPPVTCGNTHSWNCSFLCTMLLALKRTFGCAGRIRPPPPPTREQQPGLHLALPASPLTPPAHTGVEAEMVFSLDFLQVRLHPPQSRHSSWDHSDSLPGPLESCPPSHRLIDEHRKTNKHTHTRTNKMHTVSPSNVR